VDGEKLVEAVADDDEVEQQVSPDEDDGEPDGLLEALEEDRAEQRDQHERDGDRVVRPHGRVRVLDDVRRGVGRRERDRDDEVGGDEAQQDEDEELTSPTREQLFEHRDRALAVRALARDAAVDGERAEEGEQHEDERRHGRERAGGEEGDARLVAQSREVVHARQAHHLPPRVLVVVALPLVRAFRGLRLVQPLEHPAAERAERPLRTNQSRDHRQLPNRGAAAGAAPRNQKSFNLGRQRHARARAGGGMPLLVPSRYTRPGASLRFVAVYVLNITLSV
jgi:hypothetical protein